MDHDWTDWTDHEGHDGEFGDDDLSSADTADLGGYDPLADHLVPQHDGDDSWLGDQHDEQPTVHEGFGHVDAHVDEPLHDGTPEPAWDAADHTPGDAPLPDAPEGEPLADPVFGSDPDAAPAAFDTDGWVAPEFPPPLSLGELPETVDGPPWSDANLLGTEAMADGYAGDIVPGAAGPPDVAELFGYAGLDLPAGGDPWATLFSAEDPATSALARWWAPGG